MRSVLVVDAVRASGENNAARIELLNFFDWDVEGMNFGINPQLSDAACYELGILPAKIQNEEQFLMFHAKNIAKNRLIPKRCINSVFSVPPLCPPWLEALTTEIPEKAQRSAERKSDLGSGVGK